MATDNLDDSAKPLAQNAMKLSEETLRFIDLWFSDGSWAMESLGGHERTIITEILNATGIVEGNGSDIWQNEDGQVPYQCKCR